MTFFIYSFLVWFSSNPVGCNTLGTTVKTFCRDAGIEGNYANHSLRATTATRGLAKGIPDKFIMERTGHRDVRSLQQYQRRSIECKVEMSKSFDQCDCKVLSESASMSNKEGRQEISGAKKDGSDVNDGNKVKYDNNSAMRNVQRSMYFKNCSFFVTKDFST